MNPKAPEYGEDSYYVIPSYDTVYQFIGGVGLGVGDAGRGRRGVEEHFMEFLWNISVLNSDGHIITGHFTCSKYVLPISRCPEGMNLSRPVYIQNNTNIGYYTSNYTCIS